MTNDPNFTIRSARREEVEQLTELALRSKAYWGYDEDFMAACRSELTLTPAYLDTNPTFVLEDRGQVVGLYSLESLDSDDGIELGMLFVEPQAIGQGHGKTLFAHARTTAYDLGYLAMWIQSDPAAEGFYQSQGAVTVGHRESRSLPGRQLPWMRVSVRRPANDSRDEAAAGAANSDSYSAGV